MSIAEFFIENGIDPSDPDHANQICRLGHDVGDDGSEVSDIQSVRSENEDCVSYFLSCHGKYVYNASDIPDPCANSIWYSLCASDRWRQKQASGELYFSEAETNFYGTPLKINAIQAPEGMHPGALAPKWVFDAKPTKVDYQSLEVYMQCLICVLCGRFVVINDGDLLSSKGIRQMAERYNWRYWDNNGHVYDVYREKYRDTVRFDLGGQRKKDIDWKMLVGECWGNLPSDFRTSTKIPLWMRVYHGERSHINFGDFWDNIWNWKHCGTTYCSKWDQHLLKLAKSAGIPKSWPLQEADLDSMAKQKGWSKLECKQPAMAGYRKGDARLNFYLSTGTVGSCLDHHSKGKTQLFRRYLENPMALFDNPRAHTGRGYYKKEDVSSKAEKCGTKRKAGNGQYQLRACASCGEEKPSGDFSKTQRKKGSKSKCMQCA